MNTIKRYLSDKEFLILNGILLSVLLIVFYYSPFRPSKELLLLSPDSNTYFNSGGEFFDFSAQGASIIRPFLYSCFLRGFYTIGGFWIIVVLQSLFWIISANLIYYGIKIVNRYLITRIIAVALFAANISLITYIFHGLTEIVTVLLLSIATYLTIRSFKNGFNFKYWIQIMFLLSLLTVTKPLFQYPTLFFLLFGIIRFSKTLLTNKKLIFSVLLVISPVILQLTAMKVKYGITKISTIDKHTFDSYIIAQGIREIDGITDIQASQEIAQNMSDTEKRQYLIKHKKTFLNLFFSNVKDNVTGDGHSFILPEEHIEAATQYSIFMIHYNENLYLISRIFLVLFLALSVIDLFTKKLFHHWQQLTIGLLLYYIVFSSGISFWQGDRLVIFSIPLWITLYILILNRILNSNFVNASLQKLKVSR